MKNGRIYEKPVGLPIWIGTDDVICTSELADADSSDDVVYDIWGLRTL